jgi:hypothetical protein
MNARESESQHWRQAEAEAKVDRLIEMFQEIQIQMDQLRAIITRIDVTVFWIGVITGIVIGGILVLMLWR